MAGAMRHQQDDQQLQRGGAEENAAGEAGGDAAGSSGKEEEADQGPTSKKRRFQEVKAIQHADSAMSGAVRSFHAKNLVRRRSCEMLFVLHGPQNNPSVASCETRADHRPVLRALLHLPCSVPIVMLRSVPLLPARPTFRCRHNLLMFSAAFLSLRPLRAAPPRDEGSFSMILRVCPNLFPPPPCHTPIA